MRYDHYRYLYPPRPETAAAPTTLAAYEADAESNWRCRSQARIWFSATLSAWRSDRS